ncbi:MAG: metallophosphoesterase [Planctomycetia bacterium]|nr:metallophosphoesterase [Planctomycetia bacterium]
MQDRLSRSPGLRPPWELLRELLPLRSSIAVRRFAGHAVHATQLERPLRIVHVTDLHVGRVTPMRVQFEAAALANAAKPDLIALTGDFVCHGQRYLDELRDVLVRFEGPVYATLGNHDHWSGSREIRQVLRKANIEVLDNAHTVVEIAGQKVQIVGVDDAYTGHADVKKAVRGLHHDLPAIALSHIAEEAESLWEHGVPLVLSGHTHAGQVTVAGLNEMIFGRMIGHRYVHGLYGTRQTGPPSGAVYVGAGIGAAVMPLRVGQRAKREVTIFELGLPPGSIDEEHGEQLGHAGRPPTARKQAQRAAKVVRNQEKRERAANRTRRK